MRAGMAVTRRFSVKKKLYFGVLFRLERTLIRSDGIKEFSIFANPKPPIP